MMNNALNRIFGRRSKSCERGVTMIEMMIVVVITGVIASIAAPDVVNEFQRIRFRGQSRDFVSLIRQARSTAITNKVQYGVHFNWTYGKATTFKDKVVSDPAVFDAGDSVVRVDTLKGQFPMVFSTFTNSTLIFKPNGSASSSGTIWVGTYSDGGNGSPTTNLAVLSVLASTGRVRMDTTYYY